MDAVVYAALFILYRACVPGLVGFLSGVLMGRNGRQGLLQAAGVWAVYLWSSEALLAFSAVEVIVSPLVLLSVLMGWLLWR